MTNGILIGIDAGTSVIKSVAFSVDGVQLASAAIPNQYTTLADGGAEQDMARTWSDTATTLRMLADQIPDLASRVIALAVTGQGDGMWLVDKSGMPVAPAWLWLDARAADIVEEFTSSPDYAAHYERTGTGVNVCQMSVQLTWMLRHRPEVLAKASHAFHCKDWIYFNLTGDLATDPSEANFTFGSYKDRSYKPDILDQLGAGKAKSVLTPIVDGTAACGHVTEAAAMATGLRSGTPVCLGYVDVLCTGLGGGLYDPSGRSGCTIVGSTGMHMRLQPDASKVRLNAEKSGYTMAFPAPGTVAQIQSNMASTLNIDWLLDLARNLLREEGLERGRADILRGLDDKLMARQAAKILYHPYISKAGERGPFMEPSARAMFSGLDVTADYYDLMRSIFEGLAFAARDCYSAMGSIPEEVRITGGAARSNALRVILASALNARVRSVSREEAGAAGAAMIAAVQQKVFSDMTACADIWVEPNLAATTEPDLQLAETYKKAFPAYVDARKAMRPVWREMGALS
ncbi:MAG: carbohydrate kinase [Proteobacteria bacterium]|nr:carbohydrate kinase [Pseudomonadota bacterium]